MTNADRHRGNGVLGRGARLEVETSNVYLLLTLVRQLLLRISVSE